MRWTERQFAMLREMGVQAFWPEPVAQAALAEGPTSAPAVAASAQPVTTGATRAALPATADTGVPPSHVAAPAPASSRPARPASTVPAARPASPALAPAAADVVLGPRPVGVETMDWPALEAAVSSCQACGLCASRRQTVFGVGNRQARWMLIGEAPGEQEDRQGEPFVGRAGQLLDRMLQSLGLTRQDAPAEQQVFIANVLKCRPPANRNPQPQEVAQCEPFLLRQIELVKPDIILAMGRFAVQSLLKTGDPIGRLRGRVHELAGVPVVVTYHPAYLLRNPADKALSWDDLCLARETLLARQRH